MEPAGSAGAHRDGSSAGTQRLRPDPNPELGQGERRDWEGVWGQQIASLFSTAFLRNHGAVQDTTALLESNPYPMSPQAYRRQADAYLQFNALGRLGAITAPTLVVVGEQDLLTPPWITRGPADAIPDARFKIIRGDGSSHVVPLERPDDFNRLVSDFLAERLDRRTPRSTTHAFHRAQSSRAVELES